MQVVDISLVSFTGVEETWHFISIDLYVILSVKNRLCKLVNLRSVVFLIHHIEACEKFN